MPVTGVVPLRGDVIRKRREALKLSQLEVAEKIGYSRGLIAKVEAVGQVSPRVAWHLARALGVPSEEITVSGLPVPEPARSRNVLRTRVLA